MAANWTAIRRRLAVRRTAYRPPWSGRQAGHGSIVAPLAATLAASVARGGGCHRPGAGRARAPRGQERGRARERPFRSSCPASRWERIAADGARPASISRSNCSAAMEMVTVRVAERVTEMMMSARVARTRLTSGRSTRRARRSSACARCSACCARSSASGASRASTGSSVTRPGGWREHATRRSWLARSTRAARKRQPAQACAPARTSIELRELLVAERGAAARQTLARMPRAEVCAGLTGLREQAQWWKPAGSGPASRCSRATCGGSTGRGAAATGARPEEKGGAHALHAWRKQVKDLRYAAEDAGVLRPLAQRADTLGEILGEEHDLALLAALLPAPGRAPTENGLAAGRRARPAEADRAKRAGACASGHCARKPVPAPPEAVSYGAMRRAPARAPRAHRNARRALARIARQYVHISCRRGEPGEDRLPASERLQDRARTVDVETRPFLRPCALELHNRPCFWPS